MAKSYEEMEDSNPSSQPHIRELRDPARRIVLKASAGVAAATLFAPWLAGCASTPAARLKPAFAAIPVGTGDRLAVPNGYIASALAPWGEPVGLPGNLPAWRPDAGNTADEQAAQMGMHHDGIHYFPLDGSRRGLLVMNHEYVDDGLLHTDGLKTWTAEKVRKSQAAHGIAVIEVEQTAGGEWRMVRPSRFARRITANTPFSIGGPAAGHPLMRTAADPQGRTVLGTFNNCAAGMTPWGTYLSGEENFRNYFAAGEKLDAHQRRWGLTRTASFRWPEHDARFDAVQNPNEPNRFGWVVEVDPMDPASTPVKRTALGRAAHEGAWVAVTRDGRAVVYSGEDARNEYIYKFVSRDRIRPAGNGLTAAQANRELLDHGTLYVARFDAEGVGQWIALVHGQGPLTAGSGFADQGEVVIKSRQASDALGATKMDRPEWLAIDPMSGTVYCTLTNNADRGAAGLPGPDPANPRANNTHGHIIRWREGGDGGGDFDATRFRWDHLVLAGDPAQARSEAKGNIRGDLFACPDGITFDARGVLWVQTDAHATQMYKGEFANIGNNQMLACDLATGEMRRFLTGPTNCEVTGMTMTPDGRTMFINIQHPGETPSDRSDPADPARFSNWPDYRPGGRPRSATVVIRRADGGVIGT
ncbi:PhoX family phosphatase [Ramlibacter henchirensis]|uniref:PhoX family phosphatase n=1 Tax=Ramlibacter henchirensis TaxID=204072 RepID=A0A4Z0C237_9BURK|nr:PhoX family phosphatase [Ramlibacter henchirensis]TFZ05586.1 PhoX family phosphatase [Ramlibacter henchirensis]